jgi:hypothetical protein
MLLLNPKIFSGRLPEGWYVLVSKTEKGDRLVGITPSPHEASMCLLVMPELQLMRGDKDGNLLSV